MSVEETKVIDVGFQPDFVMVGVMEDHLSCVGCQRHDRPMMEFEFAERPWCSIECLTLAALEGRVHSCSKRNDKWVLGASSPTPGGVNVDFTKVDDGFTIGWTSTCDCRVKEAVVESTYKYI